jgi:predicted ATPase
VLSLDDVQWTDTGSLDALQYAGRRWTDDRTPILVLLSVRSEALADGSTLGDWVRALPRSIHVTHLELGPITAEDTLRFVLGVAVRADGAQIDAFARWLYAETAGQPLFVVETLRALLKRPEPAA